MFAVMHLYIALNGLSCASGLFAGLAVGHTKPSWLLINGAGIVVYVIPVILVLRCRREMQGLLAIRFETAKTRKHKDGAFLAKLIDMPFVQVGQLHTALLAQRDWRQGRALS